MSDDNTKPANPAFRAPVGSPDWRSIAGDLASALERLDDLYRSEQDPEAPLNRPDWLRHPLQRYHRALTDEANTEVGHAGPDATT